MANTQEKETLFYERTNLLENEADFVAIEEDGSMRIVFATYRTNGNGIEGIPSSVRKQSDISILPMSKARELYTFKKIENSRLGG